MAEQVTWWVHLRKPGTRFRHVCGLDHAMGAPEGGYWEWWVHDGRALLADGRSQLLHLNMPVTKINDAGLEGPGGLPVRVCPVCLAWRDGEPSSDDVAYECSSGHTLSGPDDECGQRWCAECDSWMNPKEVECPTPGCKRVGRVDLGGACHVCWNNTKPALYDTKHFDRPTGHGSVGVFMNFRPFKKDPE